jgi:hypothetical protein
MAATSPDPAEGCFAALFSVLVMAAALWIGFATLEYFIAQKRALNACPTSAVQHIAYQNMSWYWPFGMYASVRCTDGSMVKVGTNK